MNPILSLFISEVGKGDEEDEDDEADGERDEEGHVVDRGVQGSPRPLDILRGRDVDGNQVLVAEVGIGATRDRSEHSGDSGDLNIINFHVWFQVANCILV